MGVVFFSTHKISFILSFSFFFPLFYVTGVVYILQKMKSFVKAKKKGARSWFIPLEYSVSHFSEVLKCKETTNVFR